MKMSAQALWNICASANQNLFDELAYRPLWGAVGLMPHSKVFQAHIINMTDAGLCLFKHSKEIIVMDNLPSTVNICKDLQASFFLRLIRIMENFINNCKPQFVLKEFLVYLNAPLIDQDDPNDVKAFEEFVASLKRDEERSVEMSIAEEDSNNVLDYWEFCNRFCVEDYMQEWLEKNGFRSLTFKEFEEMVSGMVEDPAIGIVFVDTYFSQTEVTERMLKTARRVHDIRLDKRLSQMVLWRAHLSLIPTILTEKQWKALGLDWCQPSYRDVKHALIRFCIDLERYFKEETEDVKALDIGRLLRDFIASIESEHAEVEFRKMCSTGEHWGVFLKACEDQRLEELFRSDEVLAKLKCCFMSQHGEYTDGMVALWRRLRKEEYPGKDHILQTIQMFSDRFTELLFKK